MHFLSIETSTPNCSLSISQDDTILRFCNLPNANRLEDTILSSIDNLLGEAKLSFDQMDAFAIGLGPGSFTSLRVGLSTVKAFALATGKPVVGICSLDVLAEAAQESDGDEICVRIDARRGMVYSGIYEKTKNGLKRRGDYRLSPSADVVQHLKGRTIFVGDEAKPDARILAQLAFERIAKKDYDDIDRLNPIYLYADNCQVDTNVRT